MSLFADSKKFQAAVSLLNGLPQQRVPVLLTHIIKKLKAKVKRLFTDAEEEQLSSMLQLSSEDLAIVLLGCTYVFEEAAYNGITAEALASQLKSAGLSDTQAAGFHDVWSQQSAAYIERLRQHSIAPQALESLHWRLHLSVGQAGLANTKAPSALLQFNLVKDDAAETKSAFWAEFSREELSAFYDKLETIQTQLDALRG
eukprot:TRINITY_DN7658_c0_g1_i1.p2 TRINITY_DN7658_c0_g1~~TRINITY_DN7658_c0_g1_i1.p2  ORF type:complete len:200 (-),score=41.05 TRINITY_DN7658_c0_g1_i1:668-1267(-)